MSQCLELDAAPAPVFSNIWSLVSKITQFFSYADALIASLFYGLYLGVFCVAIGASSSTATVPRRIRLTMWITFCITTLNTVSLVAFMTHVTNSNTRECKTWESGVPWLGTFTNKTLQRIGNVVYTISLMAGPIVGLLSEGILAWRCYIIWGRIPWTKWALMSLLTFGAGTGIAAASLKSPLVMDFKLNGVAYNTYARLVLIWPWVFFALNTALTFAIVLKLWSSSRYMRSSRISYAARIIVESSMITWIATLLYSIASSRLAPQLWDTSDDYKINARDVVRVQLPLIFAISQSLIVARIGVMRFKNAGEAAVTIVGFTEPTYDEDI